MSRLARCLLRLYPASWRARYGDEMEALMQDSGSDFRAALDLFRGAVRMQFSTWSFPTLAFTLGLAGLLIGTAIFFTTPVNYIATGELHVIGARSEMETLRMLQARVESRPSLAQIINSWKLYAREQRTTSLEDVIQKMRGDLTFRASSPSTMSLRFTYPDREKANGTVRILLAAMAEDLRRLNLEEDFVIRTGRLEVLDPANLPISPLFPDPRYFPLWGFLAGLMLVVLWRIIFRPRLPA